MAAVCCTRRARTNTTQQMLNRAANTTDSAPISVASAAAESSRSVQRRPASSVSPQEASAALGQPSSDSSSPPHRTSLRSTASDCARCPKAWKCAASSEPGPAMACAPVSLKPSWRQATDASRSSQPSSQTEVHCSLLMQREARAAV